MEREAIVIGPGHINALGLIRSLGEEGCNSIYIRIGKKGSFTSKSKFIKQNIVLTDINQLIPFLLKNSHYFKHKPVVFAATDEVASILDINYELLSNSFILPNAKKNNEITRLMNKWEQRIIAAKHNIPTPQSWLIYKSEVNDLSYITFPCITKSQASILGGKSDVFICNNLTEIGEAIIKIKSENIIIQEYIVKKNEYTLFGISNHNDVYIPGGAKYLRFTDSSYGGYFSIQKSKTLLTNPSLTLQSIIDLIRETKYSGLFSFEFLEDFSGNLYFTEINFRNDAYSYALSASGINLPIMWYNQEIVKDNSIDTIGVMNETYDFKTEVLSRKRSIFKWTKDFLSCKAYLLYNKKDWKPFFYKLLCKND